jgi:hypothetical protein
MSVPVAQLYDQLTTDPWREEVGFSPDIENAHQELFNAPDDSHRRNALGRWLQKHQPCLFGRIAAKAGFLNYCFLDHADMLSSDGAIREKIQAARKEWTRDGFEGKKSGFIISVVSDRTARAVPDDAVKTLALRLASLYLLRDVPADDIAHDEIWLEKPGRDATTWEWFAGVNYFSAQGDKRWWHDHRMPGGMAFSVNSVGHMVKSGILGKSMLALEEALGAPPEGWDLSKVDSLGKALVLAMQTIYSASNAVSGKATELFSIPKTDAGKPVIESPVVLPPFLADKDFCLYRGRYHTDVTVPSEYFRPDVQRPDGLPEHILDFTYLFQGDIGNPDFITMGEGRPIRNDGEPGSLGSSGSAKRRRAEPRLVELAAVPRLADALQDLHTSDGRS